MSSIRDQTDEPIDLEGDLRDHLHGLAEWDGPIADATPDWLITAILDFIQPVLAGKDAEIKQLKTELHRTDAKAALREAVREDVENDMETLAEERDEAEGRAERAEATAREAANILGNALIHPRPSDCWGQIASASSECGVCRARAILLATLD